MYIEHYNKEILLLHPTTKRNRNAISLGVLVKCQELLGKQFRESRVVRRVWMECFQFKFSLFIRQTNFVQLFGSLVCLCGRKINPICTRISLPLLGEIIKIVFLFVTSSSFYICTRLFYGQKILSCRITSHELNLQIMASGGFVVKRNVEVITNS